MRAYLPLVQSCASYVNAHLCGILITILVSPLYCKLELFAHAQLCMTQLDIAEIYFSGIIGDDFVGLIGL